MSSPRLQEEFYIGYLPEAPTRLAAHLRKFIFGVCSGVALIAWVLTVAQNRFAPSFFEFLQLRDFRGLVIAQPHPTLAVLRPGKTGDLPAYSRYYLVSAGKFGADQEAARWDGQLVQLRGKLIYRDDQVMIEVARGSIALQTPATANSAVTTRSLGTFTLRGEIVDSKCFLGVMNPGDAKTHKSCAVRCISGGSPPLLVVHRSDREVSCFLLLSAAGQSVNARVLELVARPVEITGTVWQEDNLLTLRADPAKFHVLE